MGCSNGILVTTKAFGLGTDKPNIGHVVHMDIPFCVETYLQESSRGRRDKKPALAVFFIPIKIVFFDEKLDNPVMKRRYIKIREYAQKANRYSRK